MRPGDLHGIPGASLASSVVGVARPGELDLMTRLAGLSLRDQPGGPVGENLQS